MKKKIFDIFPSAGKISLPEKISQRKKDGKKSAKITEKKYQKALLAVFSVLIAVFIVCLILSFNVKMTLDVWPEQESFSTADYVKISVGADEIDFENQTVPGDLFTKEKEDGQEFSATGKVVKEEKAEGFIKIFNSTNPPKDLTLRSGTRFLSAKDSKIFKIAQKVFLPQPKKEKGEIVPTVTEVKVFAAEAGEEYNIGPSKFSVPGLSGSSLYFTVWAESASGMSGGLVKEVKKISQEDIANAQESLTKKLFSEAQVLLKNVLQNDYFLINETLTAKKEEISCSAQAETEADNFNCQGKVEIEGVAVKKSVLRQLAEKLIADKILLTKVVNETTLSFGFTLEGRNVQSNETLVTMQTSAMIYEKLDQNLLRQAVAGKKGKVIASTIAELFQEIKKVDIKFWPFWMKEAPKNPQRIGIRINL